jgi:acetyl-CoA carboxylase biotin carboxyl carrier protein
MAELLSPIDGKVWKIVVSQGQKVQVDDEVMILEALKMETPIYSEDSGTVTELRVKEGDTVSEGDVLAVIG